MLEQYSYCVHPDSISMISEQWSMPVTVECKIFIYDAHVVGQQSKSESLNGALKKAATLTGASVLLYAVCVCSLALCHSVVLDFLFNRPAVTFQWRVLMWFDCTEGFVRWCSCANWTRLCLLQPVPRPNHPDLNTSGWLTSGWREVFVCTAFEVH